MPRRSNGLLTVIAHGYDIVSSAILWEIVSEDVPRVTEHLRKLMEDYDENSTFGD